MVSALFGFGGGSDVPSDAPTTFAATDESEAGSSSGGGGFSSYLPWNWFGAGSGTPSPDQQIAASNQIPDEFSFLLGGPFSLSRRADISPVDDHLHVPEKEKVSVYLRPIGQGSFFAV